MLFRMINKILKKNRKKLKGNFIQNMDKTLKRVNEQKKSYYNIFLNYYKINNNK